ncbi:MAG: hypothetical protein DI570_08790 [Phenylobacterium zucineum]|nr:MAG: hypothetical protein DI570_08790 [Phenylobacterium zucineum]
MFKKLAATSAAFTLSLGALASPAQAWDLIDWNGTQVLGEAWTDDTQIGWGTGSLGVWYRIYFDGYASAYHNGQDPLPGLASTVLYKLTNVSADGKSWTFDYEVENASTSPVTESQVNEIGFDVTRPSYSQRLKSASLAAGGEYKTVGSGSFGPMGDNFDVCFTRKSSSTMSGCTPGANVGPSLGETGEGSFTLKFYGARTQVAFTNPFVSYDNIEFTNPDARTSSQGSYYNSSWGKDHKHSKGCGHQADDSGYGTPVAWVPEPSTWALMIVGFGGAGVALRSRRRLIAA